MAIFSDELSLFVAWFVLWREIGEAVLSRVLAAVGRAGRSFSRSVGFGLIRNEELERVYLERQFAERFLQAALENKDVFSNSSSQLGQDWMVLGFLSGLKSGFFVEFGATDGITLSNTYLLEKYFQWTGILAEPGRVWHESLRRNRSCHIDHRAVWKQSKERLEFNEVDVAELSTFSSFSESDAHAEARREGRLYEVETVSLQDLLISCAAPRIVDYLSIDTEGSEFAILSGFDFSEYTFRVISVEHNGTSSRHDIFELLSYHGYKRVLTGSSRWDDWYVFPGVLGLNLPAT